MPDVEALTVVWGLVSERVAATTLVKAPIDAVMFALKVALPVDESIVRLFPSQLPEASNLDMTKLREPDGVSIANVQRSTPET